MCPKASSTRRTTPGMPAVSARSWGSVNAPPESASAAAALRAAPSPSRSSTATCAPRRASSSTVAAPMPDAPPVTSAVLPSSVCSRFWSVVVMG